MSAGRTVLVTGATGFIGRQALAPLVQRGFEVHAVARSVPSEFASGARFHACDLLDAAQRSALLAQLRPTHLLHLAWDVTPGKFWRSPDNLDWTAASLLLLKEFRQSGGRRAVVAGTCAEYDWSHPVCRENSTPLTPRTLYGACKHGLHVAGAAYLRQEGLSLGWGRVFFLYGPHEPAVRLVPSVILPLLKGEPALCSHGRQIRDFMHVSDVAGAFCALLDSAVEGPVNIATGDAAPIAYVISLLAAELGAPDKVRMGAVPAPPDDPAELRADVTRLTQEVGYSCRFTLAEGLRDTVAWWREQLPRRS